MTSIILMETKNNIDNFELFLEKCMYTSIKPQYCSS